jgi:UDP-N-acetylmuramoyl-tripeptide--D-alanyl-D-alanine ligase
MLSMSLAQIADITRGAMCRVSDPTVAVTGKAVVDSRQAERGDLFAAFAGVHVDGHQFAEQAVAAGAVGVLASREVPVPAVVVPDVTEALGALAAWSAREMQGVTRVGVTGSSGKTTCKDLLAQVLGGMDDTVATEGSQNNEIGVPLTVLRANPSTRYLVLEMGARGIGHIAYLTRMVPLEVAVVLNVGAAHAGAFGDLEATAQAKGELVESLADDGIALLNADDPRVAAMASRTRAGIVTFGRGPGAQVRARDVGLDYLGRACFQLYVPGSRPQPVALRLLGEHQVWNALAVASVAHALEMPPQDIASRLSSATMASGSRMQRHERADGVVIIDDAYNANPDSMRASLRALAGMRASGRRVAVIGEMRELGSASAAQHEAVGELAGALGIDVVIAVGENDAVAVADGAAGTGANVRLVPDPKTALTELEELLKGGDLVLVKASRDSGLRALAADLARQ